jgi:hypothetical protein
MRRRMGRGVRMGMRGDGRRCEETGGDARRREEMRGDARRRGGRAYDLLDDVQHFLLDLALSLDLLAPPRTLAPLSLALLGERLLLGFVLGELVHLGTHSLEHIRHLQQQQQQQQQQRQQQRQQQQHTSSEGGGLVGRRWVFPWPGCW